MTSGQRNTVFPPISITTQRTGFQDKQNFLATCEPWSLQESYAVAVHWNKACSADSFISPHRMLSDEIADPENDTNHSPVKWCFGRYWGTSFLDPKIPIRYSALLSQRSLRLSRLERLLSLISDITPNCQKDQTLPERKLSEQVHIRSRRLTRF